MRFGISFKVIDEPTIDTSSRTGKLVMGLALIAEFENDIRRERQMDGIAKAARTRREVRAQVSSPARDNQRNLDAHGGWQDRS